MLDLQDVRHSFYLIIKYHQMEPLHRVWMQVFFQDISELSQMLNVLQIVNWLMVEEEVAVRLNPNLGL